MERVVCAGVGRGGVAWCSRVLVLWQDSCVVARAPPCLLSDTAQICLSWLVSLPSPSLFFCCIWNHVFLLGPSPLSLAPCLQALTFGAPCCLPLLPLCWCCPAHDPWLTDPSVCPASAAGPSHPTPPPPRPRSAPAPAWPPSRSTSATSTRASCRPTGRR